MKKLILTLVAISAASSLMAQGTVTFSTRQTGFVVGHVYGPEVGDPTLSKSGNTAAETPTGTQTYTGGFLTGSGFTAQLWYAVGAGQSEASLGLLAGSTTAFRTGSTLGGTPVPLDLVVPGVAPGTGVGTFQVRVWDNAGGTINSFDNAVTRGKSILFDVTGLGDGGLNVPGRLDGFRSFNIYTVPEPSTFVLAGLGAAGLLIFRRRK